MKVLNIDRESWNKGIELSYASYLLTGPVKEKDSHVFRGLSQGEQPDMDYTETLLSPKSVVFSQSEIMLKYTTDKSDKDYNIMQEVKKEYPARAVIGIRPFDAKAIQLTKLNFDTAEYKDPYWLNAYNACTFIGLANTNPSSTDFSISCGTGPFDESGLDVLVVNLGDTFLAKVLTEKGEAWVNAAGFKTEAGEDDLKRMEEIKSSAEDKISSSVSFDKIAGKTVLELFDDEHWEDTAFACINCGTCTYACPTCWCFDIQDEQYGSKGVRIKNWDTCMTALFTLHGSGHNPREHAWQRTRQRFMHKLKYFADKYNRGIMCVGCGRCINQCPANIDIREVCEKMNQ